MEAKKNGGDGDVNFFIPKYFTSFEHEENREQKVPSHSKCDHLCQCWQPIRTLAALFSWGLPLRGVGIWLTSHLILGAQETGTSKACFPKWTMTEFTSL